MKKMLFVLGTVLLSSVAHAEVMEVDLAGQAVIAALIKNPNAVQQFSRRVETITEATMDERREIDNTVIFRIVGMRLIGGDVGGARSTLTITQRWTGDGMRTPIRSTYETHITQD